MHRRPGTQRGVTSTIHDPLRERGVSEQGREQREWDFVDRFGLAVSVVTALLIIGLAIATTINGDTPHP